MTLEAKSSDLGHTLKELKALRDACLRMERQFQPSIEAVCPESKCSAQNLLHYLALRGHDLRDLQTRLAAMGLSSLGRSEPNALAALNAVIGVLEKLNDEPLSEDKYKACADFSTGPALLAKQSERLLGPAPKGRAVRIMVTMPSEAAQCYELVKDLVAAGMDVMRINCAHDSKVEWERMVMHAHRANQELHKHCKVLMDLAGPKLRTGAIHKGHHVLHWRISRDALGAVITPARIALVGRNGGSVYDPVDARLPVSEVFLSTLRVSDSVRLVDRRGRKRVLKVVETSENACLCTCERAAYVVSRTVLSLQRDGAVVTRTQVGTLPFVEEPVRLQTGSRLQVTKEDNPRR